VILHPAVLANVLASVITTGLVLYACCFGVQVLLHWDLESGSERQLALERRTYLVSTILAHVFVLQVLAVFLFVFTADHLTPLFAGAMCAAGTLNVNGYGYPTLMLKMATCLFAGVWLVVNHADSRGYDYPLIKQKYLLLGIAAPAMLLETWWELEYFRHLKADVITSCCGCLFGGAHGTSVAGDLAALPSGPMTVVFYATMGVTILGGLFHQLRRRGGYVFALASVVAFPVALAAIVSFISLYIYELPTHHCPFCILMRDYHYVGYGLYGMLIGAVVAGAGAGALLPFRRVPSMRAVIPSLVHRLTLASVALYAVFTAVVTWAILSSHLTL